MIKITAWAIFTVCICTGCTWELKRSTLSVSSSITPILEEQVLENLSKAYDSPYFIPAQAVLSQGAIQIQNQGTIGMKLPYTVTRTADKEVDPSVTMQWQETWTIVPVMDAPDIGRLQYLYTNAVIFANPDRFPNLLPPHQKYFGHYLNFSTQKPTSGESLATSCDGAPPHVAPGGKTVPKSPQPAPGTQNAPKAAAPPSDPFQECSSINALIQSAAYWLIFDAAPSEVLDATHPDGFEAMGSFGRHHIWVRPKEFSQFTAFVLDAVPNTQSSASNSKGLSLSLQ